MRRGDVVHQDQIELFGLQLGLGVSEQVFRLGCETYCNFRPACQRTLLADFPEDIRIAHQLDRQAAVLFLDLLLGDRGRPVVGYSRAPINTSVRGRMSNVASRISMAVRTGTLVTPNDTGTCNGE